MPIYLVQHGLCTSKHIDPTRGLSEQGRSETKRIAKVAAGYSVQVNQIVHSGKKRAEQTAGLFHELLSVEQPLATRTDINPMDDVTALAHTLTPSSTLMVVGHLPYLGRLVSFLVTGSEDTHIYQFQNSGILCLDAVESVGDRYNWFIKWTLNPNID